MILIIISLILTSSNTSDLDEIYKEIKKLSEEIKELPRAAIESQNELAYKKSIASNFKDQETVSNHVNQPRVKFIPKNDQKLKSRMNAENDNRNGLGIQFNQKSCAYSNENNGNNNLQTDKENQNEAFANVKKLVNQFEKNTNVIIGQNTEFMKQQEGTSNHQRLIINNQIHQNDTSLFDSCNKTMVKNNKIKPQAKNDLPEIKIPIIFENPAKLPKNTEIYVNIENAEATYENIINDKQYSAGTSNTYSNDNNPLQEDRKITAPANNKPINPLIHQDSFESIKTTSTEDNDYEDIDTPDLDDSHNLNDKEISTLKTPPSTSKKHLSSIVKALIDKTLKSNISTKNNHSQLPASESSPTQIPSKENNSVSISIPENNDETSNNQESETFLNKKEDVKFTKSLALQYGLNAAALFIIGGVVYYNQLFRS